MKAATCAAPPWTTSGSPRRRAGHDAPVPPTPQLLAFWGEPLADTWQRPGYAAAWVLQRMVLLLFQCCAACAGILSLREARLGMPVR